MTSWQRAAPADLSDTTVLSLVRNAWGYGVDRVEHLPAGSWAHHWRAGAGLRPLLFVTYDELPSRPALHTAASLEDAYAATADLAFALDFVVSSVPSSAATYTLPVAGGALSVTPWVVGEPGDGPPAEQADAEDTVRMLARLHGAHPPRRTPRWAPLVGADLAETLATSLSEPWDSGPLGETARTALQPRLDDVAAWTAAYLRLAAEATERPWVATHGAPHGRHRLRTPVRTLFVDWQSLKLAPRERDLRALVDAGYADLVDPDREMSRLFDLERRLDEISRYATWFAGPHPGDGADRIALDGLRQALTR